MSEALDNYPLFYDSIPSQNGMPLGDDDECPAGGEHEPLTEVDDYPQFLNGILTSTKVQRTHCAKCDLPCQPFEPYEQDRLDEE